MTLNGPQSISCLWARRDHNRALSVVGFCVGCIMMLDVAGIDAEFERLLDTIFGADVMRSFKLKRPADWICLQAAFESRKRAANPLSPASLNIPLPFSFIEFYRKHTVGPI